MPQHSRMGDNSLTTLLCIPLPACIVRNDDVPPKVEEIKELVFEGVDLFCWEVAAAAAMDTPATERRGREKEAR